MARLPRALAALSKAVDAEGAPVVAVAVPRHEIPAPAEVDEGVRLHAAAAFGPVAAAVWGAVVWSLVILGVFAPLAVARYRPAAGR
jgi:hypothetical protein